MLVADEEVPFIAAEVEAGVTFGCTASAEVTDGKFRYVCVGGQCWAGEYRSTEPEAWNDWLHHIVHDKGASPEYP